MAEKREIIVWTSCEHSQGESRLCSPCYKAALNTARREERAGCIRAVTGCYADPEITTPSVMVSAAVLAIRALGEE